MTFFFGIFSDDCFCYFAQVAPYNMKFILFLYVCWIRVRFHYGHPDVFDRIFHITRGGISKASRGINLSEDIFAGTFTNVLPPNAYLI